MSKLNFNIRRAFVAITGWFLCRKADCIRPCLDQENRSKDEKRLEKY